MLYTKFGLNWPESLRRNLKYEKMTGRRTDEWTDIYTHRHRKKRDKKSSFDLSAQVS